MEIKNNLVRSLNKYCMNNNKDYFYNINLMNNNFYKVYYNEYSRYDYLDKEWLKDNSKDFVKKVVDGKEYIYMINYRKGVIK